MPSATTGQSLRAARPTVTRLAALEQQDGDLKVAVADLRLRTRCEFAVAADCALDAYHHPFLYAGSLARVAAPVRALEVAA